MPKKLSIEEKLERKVGPEICRELIAHAKRTGETIENLAAVILAPPVRRKDLEPDMGDTKETSEEEGGLKRLQGKRFENPSDYKTGGIEEENAKYLEWFNRDCYPHGRLFTPDFIINTFTVYIRKLIRPSRDPFAHHVNLYYRIPPSKDVWGYNYWHKNKKTLRASVLKRKEFLESKKGKLIEVVDVEVLPLRLKPCPAPMIWEQTPRRISDDIFRERYNDPVLKRRIQKAARNFARGDHLSVPDLEQEAWERVAGTESDDIELLEIEVRKAMDAFRNRKNQLSFENNPISLDEYLDSKFKTEPEDDED